MPILACSIIDTPFLTVLKTWTPSFEHSLLIHACVRFEFPEVSATRLASRSLNLSILCLVVDQGLVFLLLGKRVACWPFPQPIGQGMKSSDNSFGRAALFLAGRPSCWSIGHVFWLNPVHLLYADLLCQLHAQFTPSIHVYGGICTFA